MTEVIRVYTTEEYAKAENSSYDIASATVNSDGGTIHNSDNAIPYFTYNKYYYRIDSNEPVSEFHIDWDDGEDNSPEKRNIQIIKKESPSFYTVTEHVYTEAKPFWPLIRVKSPDGYLSKWYTNNSTNNDFSSLENETLLAGNTGTSMVQVEKDGKDKIPHFIPSRSAPIGVLKSDRKRIFAGIDNKRIDAYTTTQYPLLYAYTDSSESLGTDALIKLTVQGRIERETREYTLHGEDIATADTSIDNSTTGGSPAGIESELATKAVPFGNYRNGSNAYEQTSFVFKTADGTAANGDRTDLNADYIIIWNGNLPYLIYFDVSGSETTPPTVTVPGGGSFADTLRVRLDNSALSDVNDEFSGGTETQTNTGFATKLYRTAEVGSVSIAEHTFDTAFTVTNPSPGMVNFEATTYENQPDPTVSDNTHIGDAGGTPSPTSANYVTVQGQSIVNLTDCAGSILKAELLNVGKISDTERIHIKTFDATRAALNTFIDVDADETVCILSNGNPIVELNDSRHQFTVNASESFTRESNIDISSYYYDLDTLDNTTIQSQATVSSSLGNIADEFHADLAKPISTSTSHTLSYTHDTSGYLQDSYNRFLDFHRLIRVQVADDHTIVTGSGDVSNRRSFVEHYDDDQYASTTSSPVGANRIPASMESRGYMALSNSQQVIDFDEPVRHTIWRELADTSRTNGIMIGGYDGGSHGEDKFDIRIGADLAQSAGASSNIPHNWLFLCKSELFDRVYFRTDNTYAIGDTPTDIDITAYYSHTDGWKPLKIVDNTQRLKTSGSIEFVVPNDWEKTTSQGITRSDPDGTEILNSGRWGGPVDAVSNETTNGLTGGAARTGHDPDTIWDFPAYGILIGINANETGTTNSRKIEVKSIWPFSNSHSQYIKIVDPHHVSLNNIAIAQSISFNRETKVTNITDRFGKSEIRKLGAEGGAVTFGGVDLGDTDVKGNRKKIKEFQQNATPVFLDVTHTSGEKTRFFGVIISMSEDHPVGKQFPKFGIKMLISHIIELDANDNLLSDKISIGGEVDGASKYVSSA